jgi:hypothetical protein
MTTPHKEGKTAAKAPAPVAELNEIRRSLQDAGLTLLQAATAAISAAANETLSATEAVIAAADDTLAAAEEKVRTIRKDLRKH